MTDELPAASKERARADGVNEQIAQTRGISRGARVKSTVNATAHAIAISDHAIRSISKLCFGAWR
jgi:hypothetical protein